MNNIILQCENLSKTYHDGVTQIRVLDDINFTVQRSEIIAIVGASGSGKSTLLHLLAGLDQPSHGKVFLQSAELAALPESKKCQLRNQLLGFIYQHHHLLPEFTALENVAMPLLIAGKSLAAIKEQAHDILQRVGLENRATHKLSQLSGGERQRVAIARALVTRPLCVLADEPTGNLDPQNAERILQLFFDLQAAQQTSVIIVTHDLNIAKRADRIMRIVNSQLIIEDSAIKNKKE